MFLSKVVREVEEEEDGESGSEEEEHGDAATSKQGDGQETEGKEEKKKAKGTAPIVGFWAENDLNVSEVQGVKMWDKEVWAGRL